ncbi:MAG: hypothetical protein ACRDP7_11785 [Trebonia sp.]
MTSPAAREMPRMPPGWATDASASTAGERTGINCAGLPVRSSAGQGPSEARGGKGPVCQDGDFGRRGSDRTGRQVHYRDMESSAGEAASARARRPARSGSDIPPPVTALASCSPIPPPPSIAQLTPGDDAV